MGTLFDYLSWRGDLSFEQDPLNEVDSLIFSLVSYIEFKGIVSEAHGGATVSLRAAANSFFARHPDPRKISMGLIVPKEIIKLLRAVRECRRFRSVGMKTKVFTPFTMGPMAEMFTKDAAVECLEKGVVTFFAGGTGHPYFSTDTTTTLRAVEIEADVILLAKAVDGVYDSDPKVNPEAKKYDEIPIQQVIDQKLGVMDLTASIMCMENKMPMMVFGLNEENSIVNTLKGKFSGTKVTV